MSNEEDQGSEPMWRSVGTHVLGFAIWCAILYWQSACFAWLWNWYVAPLGLYSFTPLRMLGVVLILRTATFQTPPIGRVNGYWERLLKNNILLPTLALAAGWAASFFL